MNKGFKDFMDSVDADVFCVQETKMQREQANFEFPGYFEYWNSAEKKGYSGTAIFSKVEPISVSYDMGIEEHDKEGRIICAEYDKFYNVQNQFVYDFSDDNNPALSGEDSGKGGCASYIDAIGLFPALLLGAIVLIAVKKRIEA